MTNGAEPSPCQDCGVDTTPCTGRRGCRHKGTWQHYMVTAELWASAGLPPDGGFLCVGCLEQRIGRALEAADFTDVPINGVDSWDTAALAAAKQRWPAQWS